MIKKSQQNDKKIAPKKRLLKNSAQTTIIYFAISQALPKQQLNRVWL